MSLQCAVALLPLVLSGQLFAGTTEPVERILRDLSHEGVIMSLSAHPDDEDGASLAYYRLHDGVKTHAVFFTRGEGGQNEIGPELYEELGVIRTTETERAGEVIGAEVHFLNLFDFGFSKSASETFPRWGGKNEVLRRLVYMIRKYKPDVILTNHTPGGGHGHHQAVAITAINAFDAAADPSMFPEQFDLPGVSVWQVKKLYFRVWPWTGGKPDVKNPIQERYGDRTYLEIAESSIREHRSQGLATLDLARFSGGKSEYRIARTFSAYESDSSSFFGGITLLTDESHPGLRAMRVRLGHLSRVKETAALLDSAIALAESLRGMDRQSMRPVDSRIADEWEESLGHLIRAAGAIEIAALPDDTLAVPGQAVSLTVSAESRASTVKFLGVSVDPAPGWNASAGTNDRQVILSAGMDAALTHPPVKTQYNPIESRWRSTLQIRLSVNGKEVSLKERVRIPLADPLEISVDPPAVWVRPDDPGRGAEFSYSVTNHRPHKTAGTLRVIVPDGWRADQPDFEIAEEEGRAHGKLFVTPPRNSGSGSSKVRIRAEDSEANVAVRLFNVAVSPELKLGIIKSYDNTLETVAATLGIPFTMIDEHELSQGDLNRYTTIVVDIRAYAVRDDLRQQNGRLLEFITNGGNLVVFYQKSQDWEVEFAPFPFRISRERVTVEEAPVRVLLKEHPLMTVPNRILLEDWEGWVQERGVYFPSDAGPEYERILSSHDPDEPPLDTGLIVARYGKGSYIYSSYVWYRQMKELHEGAIKCFANLISYGHVR